MPKLPTFLARHQETVDLFSSYCTTHQNLIWGISVVSGVSVGWMGYVNRRYHQRQIENKVESVTKRLSEMEKQRIRDRYFYRVAMPLCVSTFCIGVGIGKFHANWRSYRYLEQWKGDFVSNIESQMKVRNMGNYPVMAEVIRNIQKQQAQNTNISETLSTSSYNPKNWMKK